MKTFLKLLFFSLAASLTQAQPAAKTGEALTISLPSGYVLEKIEKAADATEAAKRGDVLLQLARNPAKDELRVYRSPKLRVSNKEIPRFVEALRGFYAQKANAKVGDVKVRTFGERHWGVLEMTLPGTRPEVKRIILVVSVDGSPARIELDTQTVKLAELRARAEHVLTQSVVEIPVPL